MLPVDDAVNAITANARPCPNEWVELSNLHRRVLARNTIAALTQPPFAASAMDGYAVRAADLQKDMPLRVIAEARAGDPPYSGKVETGQAVRLYTGSAVPNGADYVLIQERAERDGESIRPNDDGPWPPEHNNIRIAGCDFSKGQTLLTAGTRMTAVHGALLAAANLAGANVIGRPHVAVFSNGAELVDPGSAINPGQIVDSNRYALCALTSQWGGQSAYLGRAGDTVDAAAAMFEQARSADVVLPVGGASVGQYDVVKPALKAAGGSIIFEGVAVRPGKPVWFGRLGKTHVIGLPGNPASAIVTAVLFAQPLVRLMAGYPPPFLHTATLAAALPATGPRETWLRASLSFDTTPATATPHPHQDSSLMMPFAHSAALIRRPVQASPAKPGDPVHIAILDDFITS